MISKEDVKRISALARIHIKEDELESFAKTLEDILDYVETLNEVNVDSIEPTSHAMPLENVMREDKVIPSLDQKDVLKFAVSQLEGSFKVPKVI